MSPFTIPIVDTVRYPLDDVVARRRIIDAARADLADSGVAILEGFVRAGAVAAICAEAEALEPIAKHQGVEGTPYLGLPDESFPAGHPRRALVRSHLTAIAYDLFPTGSLLRSLYEWDGLTELVAEMLDQPVLHRYADPLGALNVAVMRDGDELGWHFDQTDFVVSIALQSSEEGGLFESACRVRDAEDERYGVVSSILAGERTGSAVTTVPMRPGTLMLFEGRNSLHRVTPIVGPTPRHVALLAYDTKPGTDSTDLLKLVRYGRLP